MIKKISRADGNYTMVSNVVFHTIGIMPSKNNKAYLSGPYNQLRQMNNIQEPNLTE